MPASYRLVVDEARYTIATCIGSGNTAAGMQILNEYYRRCERRAWLVNAAMIVIGSAPGVAAFLGHVDTLAGKSAVLVGLLIAGFVIITDFAWGFLNHADWQWIWPKPSPDLAAAFESLYNHDTPWIGRDTLRIVCDIHGRRRAVPELRLGHAHRI